MMYRRPAEELRKRSAGGRGVASSSRLHTLASASVRAWRADPRGDWTRAPEQRRYFVVELAVTALDTPNPGGCPGGPRLFAVESRLESDNGDLVASTNQNFDPVDANSTEIDLLTYEIADDVTSLVLRGQNGEEFGRWENLELPAG